MTATTTDITTAIGNEYPEDTVDWIDHHWHWMKENLHKTDWLLLHSLVVSRSIHTSYEARNIAIELHGEQQSAHMKTEHHEIIYPVRRIHTINNKAVFEMDDRMFIASWLDIVPASIRDAVISTQDGKVKRIGHVRILCENQLEFTHESHGQHRAEYAFVSEIGHALASATNRIRFHMDGEDWFMRLIQEGTI